MSLRGGTDRTGGCGCRPPAPADGAGTEPSRRSVAGCSRPPCGARGLHGVAGALGGGPSHLARERLSEFAAGACSSTSASRLAARPTAAGGTRRRGRRSSRPDRCRQCHPSLARGARDGSSPRSGPRAGVRKRDSPTASLDGSAGAAAVPAAQDGSLTWAPKQAGQCAARRVREAARGAGVGRSPVYCPRRGRARRRALRRTACPKVPQPARRRRTVGPGRPGRTGMQGPGTRHPRQAAASADAGQVGADPAAQRRHHGVLRERVAGGVAGSDVEGERAERRRVSRDDELDLDRRRGPVGGRFAGDVEHIDPVRDVRPGRELRGRVAARLDEDVRPVPCVDDLRRAEERLSRVPHGPGEREDAPGRRLPAGDLELEHDLGGPFEDVADVRALDPAARPVGVRGDHLGGFRGHEVQGPPPAPQPRARRTRGCQLPGSAVAGRRLQDRPGWPPYRWSRSANPAAGAPACCRRQAPAATRPGRQPPVRVGSRPAGEGTAQLHRRGAVVTLRAPHTQRLIRRLRRDGHGDRPTASVATAS